MEIFRSASPEETESIALRFAERLGPGSVVALIGPLGAGKTAFVKGIAARFGAAAVTSPTYTLVNHYDGSVPVYHSMFTELKTPTTRPVCGSTSICSETECALSSGRTT